MKKILSLIIASALLLPIIGGCNSADEDENPGSNNSSEVVDMSSYPETSQVKADKAGYQLEAPAAGEEIAVLHTNKGDILQTSSEVSGQLPADYRRNIGDILAAQLPAGSITGAPKDKTVAIISQAEGYKRGFYTGVMGVYDNGELNSAVMIRFIEQDQSGMYFKAGGGITWMSDCRKEYEEVIQNHSYPIGR